LKYPGLSPWEIWLSEAQERMVIAVPPANVARVGAIADALDVEMTDLGEFTGDGVLRVLHGTTTVGELDCAFLHGGIPRQYLVAEWTPPPHEVAAPTVSDATARLLDLLRQPNIRSKEEIVRRYDHEVQGGTVVKPFVGVTEHGPGDAAVVTPLPVAAGTPGAALGIGCNPAYGALDPYRMAWAAVDEAVRNVVAVGADPDRISLLDNFSWGNPRLPDVTPVYPTGWDLWFAARKVATTQRLPTGPRSSPARTASTTSTPASTGRSTQSPALWSSPASASCPTSPAP